MSADPSLPVPYFGALDLLTRALGMLDDLNEGIAAAQLSGVIDLVAARIGDDGRRAH